MAFNTTEYHAKTTTRTYRWNQLPKRLEYRFRDLSFSFFVLFVGVGKGWKGIQLAMEGGGIFLFLVLYGLIGHN